MISSDLSFQMASYGTLIPIPDVRHIADTTIKYASDVTNIVSFLVARNKNVTSQDLVSTACTFIECCLSSDDLDRSYEGKVRFLLEQLELIFKIPTRRRYAAKTTAMCMWLKTSTSMYEVLISDDVLTIPCVNYLRRLSGALAVDMEFSENTKTHKIK